MKHFRYLEEVGTLRLDGDACVGCGMCGEVCPHAIFEIREKKAVAVDPGACMECGACALNCPVRAITVNPGVGCASYIIAGWLHRFRGKKVVSACC